MLKIVLNENEYRALLYRDFLYSGDEGLLVIDPLSSGRLIKLYRDEKDEKFEQHLISICDRKDEIHLSTFPYGGIYFDGSLIGSSLHYFRGYFPVNYLKFARTNEDVFYKLDVLRKIQIILKELISHDIYYIDLSMDNIVVHSRTSDVQFVDFDSLFVKFGKENASEFLKNYRDFILDFCFYEFPYVEKGSIKSFFVGGQQFFEIEKKTLKEQYVDNLGLSLDMVDNILGSNLSMELLDELVGVIDRNNLVYKHLKKMK